MANTNLTIKERLTSPSPDLFVKIQNYTIIASLVFGALATFTKQYLGIDWLTAILGTLSAFCGTILYIISKLPVDFDKKEIADQEKADEKELNKTELD